MEGAPTPHRLHAIYITSVGKVGPRERILLSATDRGLSRSSYCFRDHELLDPIYNILGTTCFIRTSSLHRSVACRARIWRQEDSNDALAFLWERWSASVKLMSTPRYLTTSIARSKWTIWGLLWTYAVLRLYQCTCLLNQHTLIVLYQYIMCIHCTLPM